MYGQAVHDRQVARSSWPPVQLSGSGMWTWRLSRSSTTTPSCSSAISMPFSARKVGSWPTPKPIPSTCYCCCCKGELFVEVMIAQLHAEKIGGSSFAKHLLARLGDHFVRWIGGLGRLGTLVAESRPRKVHGTPMANGWGSSLRSLLPSVLV